MQHQRLPLVRKLLDKMRKAYAVARTVSMDPKKGLAPSLTYCSKRHEGPGQRNDLRSCSLPAAVVDPIEQQSGGAKEKEKAAERQMEIGCGGRRYFSFGMYDVRAFSLR